MPNCILALLVCYDGIDFRSCYYVHLFHLAMTSIQTAWKDLKVWSNQQKFLTVRKKISPFLRNPLSWNGISVKVSSSKFIQKDNSHEITEDIPQCCRLSFFYLFPKFANVTLPQVIGHVYLHKINIGEVDYTEKRLLDEDCKTPIASNTGTVNSGYSVYSIQRTSQYRKQFWWNGIRIT